MIAENNIRDFTFQGQNLRVTDLPSDTRSMRPVPKSNCDVGKASGSLQDQTDSTIAFNLDVENPPPTEYSTVNVNEFLNRLRSGGNK